MGVKVDPQNLDACQWLKSIILKRPLQNCPNIKIKANYMRLNKKII